MKTRIKKIHSSKEIDFYLPDFSIDLNLPVMGEMISAGFPSPADDYIDDYIDLNKELIKNPASTFIGRVKGSSMINSGISEGDLIIVDKAINPKSNSIIVCFIDGDFTMKRVWKKNKSEIFLIPDNPDFPPIKVNEGNDFKLWGTVCYSIKKHI